MRVTKRILRDKLWYWICLCGNEPMEEGYFACNGKGEFDDRTPPDQRTKFCVCKRCGRIIDVKTEEVVGVLSVNARTQHKV